MTALLTTNISKNELELLLIERMKAGPFTFEDLEKMAAGLGFGWRVVDSLIRKRRIVGEIVYHRVGASFVWEETS